MPCIKTKEVNGHCPRHSAATSPLCVAASGSACREAPSLALACWIPKATASSPPASSELWPPRWPLPAAGHTRVT